jgi:polyisoprenoid-binding protein YceI
VKKLALITAPALIGLAAIGTVGLTYLQPPAQATAPIESVAMSPTAAAAGTTIYEIDSDSSQVTFTLNEVLNGSPFTVVGTTDQVAGQIALNPANADEAQIGTILVNARTLATDSAQRDRMIQNMVLQTSANEYISFTPTALVGLPDALAPGKSYQAQVTGDLSIKGIARPVTFNLTVTPVSTEQIVGNASTTVSFSDWGVSIPSVPSVASVDKDVQLSLNFTANAA